MIYADDLVPAFGVTSNEFVFFYVKYFCPSLIGFTIVGVFLSFLLYGHSDNTPVRVGVLNEDHQLIAADTIKIYQRFEPC